MADNLVPRFRLVLVTDDAVLAGRDLVATCVAAESGGVTSVQLRLKRPGARELAEAGRILLGVLRVPLIVNDRLDVAIAIGAAGVHLGPDDVPVELARRVAPEGFIIGASVGHEGELENGRAADYWGVGPWRQTGTKGDAGAPLGADGFRKIAALAGTRPVVAIGGIRPEDVQPALAAGASGVAVVSGILGAPNVEEAAREYSRHLAI
jgi:thiamine-phosphate pyrophosphorylase